MNDLINLNITKVVSNILAIRTFRNYSQDYVASKLGMTQNGYSKIETGCSSISLQKLFDIALALDVDVTDLFNLDVTNLNKVQLKKVTMAV